MTFPYLSSFAYFWWLLALGIPVLIHLLNRRRHRVVKWAAMDFLLKATRESKGKKKLKHIIILTARALAIVALVLAIARPLKTSGLFGWGGGKIDTVILILDRSPSMELTSLNNPTSKRETAIALAIDSFRHLENTRLILIDSATASPTEIPSPSSLNKISQTHPTDASADIPTLLDKAIKYTLSHDTGNTEIWLASDLQSSNWHSNSGKWRNIQSGFQNLSENTSLRILALNSPASDNTSLQLSKAQRLDDELLIEFTLHQSSSQNELTLPVTLSLNGSQTTENITIKGASTTLTKSLSLSKNSGYGYIQIPADTNNRDNTVFFTYGDEAPTHTAVVATNKESRLYLQIASAPPGFANQHAKTYQPNQSLPYDSLSLIIWQAPIPTGDTQRNLLRFAEKGGIVAFFPPTSESDNKILGTQWGILSKAARGKYFIAPRWDRNDGPLRNGADGTPVPVSKLRAIQRRDITTTNPAALAKWKNDSALLSRQLHGRGALYFISTLPDYTWSNLGDADVLLPLIQRFLQQGRERFGSGAFTTVGNLPAEIALDAAKRQRLDTATPHSDLNAPFEAGIFRFDTHTLAINPPASETDPESLTKDQLDSTLLDIDYSYFEENSKSTSGDTLQLWQPFLILMLLFMITEAILCLAPKRKKVETL